MAVPEYVWAVLSITTGIIVVYYICLKLSDNGWIGERPKGPRHHPFIGCYLMYAGTRNLEALVQQLFTRYGDMFALSLFNQKVVFIRNSKEVEELVAASEVRDISLSYLAAMLQQLGIHRLQELELELLSRAWQAYCKIKAQENITGGPELPLLVKLLQDADHELAMESGELSSLPPIFPQKSSERLEQAAGQLCLPAARAVQAANNLRELLLRQGHVLLGKKVPFPAAIYVRKRGRKHVEEVSRSLREVSSGQGLLTDPDLLLAFFLLILLAGESKDDIPSSGRRQELHVLVGEEQRVSIGGYRIYQCRQYVQLRGCNIPEKTLLVARKTASPGLPTDVLVI